MNESSNEQIPGDDNILMLHPTAPPRLAPVRRPGRPRFEIERFTLTQVLELAAELLTTQLKLEIPTHSASPRRRMAQARRRGREFGQIFRDVRVRMEELCEAQAALEELRGSEGEGEARQRRDQAELQFRETFLLLAGQLPSEE